MRRKFTNLCEYIKAHIKVVSFKNYLLNILFTLCSSPKPLTNLYKTCSIRPAGFAATVVKDSHQLNNATALYSSFLFSTEVTDGIITDHINQRTEKTLTSPKPQDNS